MREICYLNTKGEKTWYGTEANVVYVSPDRKYVRLRGLDTLFNIDQLRKV